jgi:DNA-binding CsgD family transcriptional regulator
MSTGRPWERVAALTAATVDATLRYEVLALGSRMMCVRAATLRDGSLITLTVPLMQPGALREFVQADPALETHRRAAQKLLAAAEAAASRFTVERTAQPPGPTDLAAVAARLALARDLLEMHDSLTAVANHLGLDGYAAVVGDWSASRRTVLHGLAGVRAAWCQRFMHRHWYLNSALLNAARRHDRPAFGSEVPADTQGQRLMRQETRSLGLKCAMAFPRWLPPEIMPGWFGALLFLGAAEPAVGERMARQHATLLRGMAATFIDRWAELIVAEQVRDVRLSATERRLLLCARAGQTAAQAAASLSLSTTAANNYYRRMNVKLGVSTKKAALARAEALGMLDDDRD